MIILDTVVQICKRTMAALLRDSDGQWRKWSGMVEKFFMQMSGVVQNYRANKWSGCL